MERHADLLANGFISQSAFDVKQNAYNARGARSSRRARRPASLATRRRTPRSWPTPTASCLASPPSRAGRRAGPAVLKLAHAGEKEVVVNAPESQLARFKVGHAVRSASGPDACVSGRIREVAGGADR
jgi:multidrug resistance efflux pump